MPVVEVETRSAEETEALAARLARRLSPGDVVLGSGELGTGKTTFVRGACRALGVTLPGDEPDLHVYDRYAGSVEVSDLDLDRFRGLSAAGGGDPEPYFEGAVAFVVVAQVSGLRPAVAPGARQARARLEGRHGGLRSTPTTRRC